MFLHLYNPTCPRPSQRGHATIFLPLHALHGVGFAPFAISARVVQPPVQRPLFRSSETGTSIASRSARGPHVELSCAVAVRVVRPFRPTQIKWRHFPPIAVVLVHFEPTKESRLRIGLRRANPPFSRTPRPAQVVHARRPVPPQSRQGNGPLYSRKASMPRNRRALARKSTSRGGNTDGACAMRACNDIIGMRAEMAPSR